MLSAIRSILIFHFAARPFTANRHGFTLGSNLKNNVCTRNLTGGHRHRTGRRREAQVRDIERVVTGGEILNQELTLGVGDC
jgi:hypothetical protein